MFRLAAGSLLCIAACEAPAWECAVEAVGAGDNMLGELDYMLEALEAAYDLQAMNASWMSLDGVEVARQHVQRAKTSSRVELTEDTYLHPGPSWKLSVSVFASLLAGGVNLEEVPRTCEVWRDSS